MKQLDKEVVFNVKKLIKAIFDLQGQLKHFEEVKDHIETALLELNEEEEEYELLKMSYVDNLTSLGIANRLDCTIQQAESLFEIAIASVIEETEKVYIHFNKKMMKKLDECLAIAKEK